MSMNPPPINEAGEEVVSATAMTAIHSQARRWAGAPWIVGMEYDDLVQEGMLRHLQRRKDPLYKPGVEIKQRLFRLCRDQTLRGGHRPGTTLRAVQATERLERQGIARDPELPSMERERRVALAHSLMASLTAEERRIVMLRFERNTATDIATPGEHYDPTLTRQQISRVLDAALCKMRAQYERQQDIDAAALEAVYG